MTSYTISTEAYDVTYDADTEEGAILAMVRDAGYASIADAADVLGETEQDFINRQIITAA